MKKNSKKVYGNKNNISIDMKDGFIRRYGVTLANINNSKKLPVLLNPETTE